MYKPLSIVACLAMMAAVLVGPAEAQTAAEVDGVWRGEASGNETRLTLRPGGDIEARAVTNNTQSAFQIFRLVGNYTWDLGLPGAVMRLQGGDMIVNQPGFNDTFHRISAPPVRAPATTPTAPPPQRVLTAAEQQRLQGAQAQLQSSQANLNSCRSMALGAFCAEFETQVAEDQRRLNQITAQPSVPLPPPTDAQRRSQLESELERVEFCRSMQVSSLGDLDVGGTTTPQAREERAREARAREQRAAACQPDMNRINGTTAPATTQASASIPDITPEWSSNLAQSTDAAEAHVRDNAHSRRVHIGANDATDCMFVGTTLVTIEWGNEARLRMQNTCEYPVAVRWCANTQDCELVSAIFGPSAPAPRGPFSSAIQRTRMSASARAGSARKPRKFQVRLACTRTEASTSDILVRKPGRCQV